MGRFDVFGVTEIFHDHQTWLLKLMAMSRRMFDKLYPLAQAGIGRV